MTYFDQYKKLNNRVEFWQQLKTRTTAIYYAMPYGDTNQFKETRLFISRRLGQAKAEMTSLVITLAAKASVLDQNL